MDHDKFMGHAIKLAKKGIGFTAPNPVVGAVVVKNGEIIGEGWHTKVGAPHAEVVAITQAKQKGSLHDTTLFVTLEPCCHYGRTPPCVDLIISSGIPRVVIGMTDSFWRVNRNGIKRLSEAGVIVELVDTQSELFRQVCYLNQAFLKWAQTGLPNVVLKTAATLDGKIATASGDAFGITSEPAIMDARIERSIGDAVLVGSGTVAHLNPMLQTHGIFQDKPLLRVVIDPTLSLDVHKSVFRDQNVFVATTKRASAEDQDRFRRAGISFHIFGPTEVPVKLLLQYLGKKGITRLFVEGGNRVHSRFHDSALHDPMVVDEVLYYIAPKILGGQDALQAVGGSGVTSVINGLNLKDISVVRVGEDIRLRGFVNFYC